MGGLTVAVADISEWLAGTTGNIQTQIDGINDSLLALTSGMQYIGKFESYSDLQSIGNKENGDLAVVLADENRTGGRSMYVYSDNYGMWEFIGEFTFTDEFLALKDTPTSYAGADGKVVKVAGERLVFGEVDYEDLANKPSSTITQIDDAVAKRHEHTNKSELDRLGINDNGELTINGVVYAPKETPKKHIYARRGTTSQELSLDSTCIFNTSVCGTIPYDINTGIFTLEANKTYRVTVTASMLTEGYVTIHLVDAVSNEEPHANSAIWTDVTRDWREASAGSLEVVFSPATTRGFKIKVKSINGTTAMRPVHSVLIVQEI